jgi:hypothetical protein
MSVEKKYVSVLNDGTQDLYIKDAEAQERLDQLSEWEAEGAIDTLFDTTYNATNERIDFGSGCASMETETGLLTVEGAVVPIFENGEKVGNMIVIS